MPDDLPDPEEFATLGKGAATATLPDPEEFAGLASTPAAKSPALDLADAGVTAPPDESKVQPVMPRSSTPTREGMDLLSAKPITDFAKNWGSAIAHGALEPWQEQERRRREWAAADTAAREARAAPTPDQGAMRAPIPEPYNAPLETLKALGKSAWGAAGGAAYPVGALDEATGLNLLPAWHKSVGEAVDKIPGVPRGSIVGDALSDEARKNISDTTKFAVENAPLLVAGHGVKEAFADPLAREPVDAAALAERAPTPEVRGVEPIERPSVPADLPAPEEFASLAPAEPQRGNPPIQEATADGSNPGGAVPPEPAASPATPETAPPTPAPVAEETPAVASPSPAVGQTEPAPAAPETRIRPAPTGGFIAEVKEGDAWKPVGGRHPNERYAQIALDKATKGDNSVTLGAGLGGVGESIGKFVEQKIEKPWMNVADAATGAVGKLTDKIPGVRPAKNFLASAFKTPEELISPEYAQTKEGGRGEVRVGRAEGAFFGNKIEKALEGVSDADRRGVYDYLSGSRSGYKLPQSITPAQKAAIDEAASFIDEGRTELVNRGRLSPDAYDEYTRYLRRQFDNVELAREAQKGPRPFQAVGDKPRLDPRWSRQDAYELRVDLPRADVEDLIKSFRSTNAMSPDYMGELKGTTLVKFQDTPAGKIARDAFEQHIKSSYAYGRRTMGNLASGEIRAGDVGQAKQLYRASLETPTAGELNVRTADPISPELRDLMGEDVNPASAVAKTIANVKGEVAKFDTMQSILDGGDARGQWAIRRAEGQKPSDAPAGYKHVANKRLGPLDDTFVREDVAKDLEGVYGNRSPSGPDQVFDFFRGATDRWKTWRTVRNPAGHVQNVISAPMTAIEAGVSPLNPDNWQHYADTIKAMQTPDPFDPIQREIIRNGIDEGARLSAYELGKVRDVWNNPGTTTGYKVGQTLTDPVWWTKTAADFDQAAGRYYNFADRVIRQSLYRKLRAEGLDAAEATLETDKFTTNYARQGRFVQGMRHAPLSPFISYAYERLRVLKNNLAEHPTRAAATLGAGYALRQAVEATLGSGVSEEEKKGAHAEYGGSRWGDFGDQFNIVTGRNEDGTPRVWDAGALFTADRPLRGPRDALDQSALEQNARWLASTLGFEAGPMTTQAVSQLSGRDMFTNKELLTPQDRLESFGKEVLPPFTPYLGSKAQKIQASAAGEQYAKTKPPISLKDALLDALLHIRIDGYSPAQSTQNLLWQAGRADTHEEQLLDRAVQTGDEGKIQEGAAKFGSAEEELWRRFGEKMAVHSAAGK